MTMNSNLSNLNDIYMIVSMTDFKRTPELLKFLEDMIDIESDVMYESENK